MCAATASSAANVTSNDYRRAETSPTSGPRLSETERLAVLRDALEAARAISDDSDRARALACLAPHLPESLLNRLEANSSCNP